MLDFYFRKHWLQYEGSPKSRIDKCEFKDEVTIKNLQFSMFDIRR